MKVGDKMYRYNDIWVQSGICDRVAVHLEKYYIVKLTPEGYWISRRGHVHSIMSLFILADARKKFAYETKREALHSLVMRKARQIKIVTAQLKKATYALAEAERMADEESKRQETEVEQQIPGEDQKG